MKVAVTAQGPDPEACVDPRFGRCAYFVIIDTDKGTLEVIPNDNAGAGGGAGIGAAQALVNRGVNAVLTGQVGPNAMRVMRGAGIKIYSTTAGTVKAALEQWREGKATELTQATVGAHFGMGKGGNRF